MTVPCAPSAAPASVRRYLGEAGEREVLRVLRGQQQRHKRVTSDDVRLAARAVANRGGSVAVPPDFPPSRWVIDFKRTHGFVQFNSFAFGAAATAAGGGQAAFGLPERLELPSRRTQSRDRTAANEVAARAEAPVSHRAPHSSNDKRSSSAGAATGSVQVTISSQSSGNSSDDEKERNPSEDSRGSSSDPRGEAMYDPSSPPPGVPGLLPAYDDERQRAMQLQRSFSQRHRQFMKQQHHRAMLVDDHRRVTAAWPRRQHAAAADHDHEEMRSNSSSGSLNSDNGTTTGPSNSPRGGDVRPDKNAIPPHIRHSVSTISNSADDMQDSASNTSSSTLQNDKRGYKLSHMVPAETWEKAIAAVEQQGMSLRAAAKLYGVHFAALHRRVKKRAQGGASKGSNGYFHPSDEAGIMRVVVARAELGVLMTFDELMRLVEAAALRKLPDISVEGARNLLTRFLSRNENSIRHIIDDWPPPRSMTDTSSLVRDSKTKHQPYLEHPGFGFGSNAHGGAATAAAVAAAVSTTLFVPPSLDGKWLSAKQIRGVQYSVPDVVQISEKEVADGDGLVHVFVVTPELLEHQTYQVSLELSTNFVEIDEARNESVNAFEWADRANIDLDERAKCMVYMEENLADTFVRDGKQEFFLKGTSMNDNFLSMDDESRMNFAVNGNVVVGSFE
ncbi:putative DNA-binding protein [Phytophthora cinnamomi]|uniref:putative DNA-binding protein n=1 Tax=Phytophthora cinnamomi TaxID=4785 RepID=UPI0035597356|nr:putative DNA-binding protein [Phytophthora cinnamomi]